MFLGLSLTTWLWILGALAIVTPIVGKQAAKDSIRIKDSLKNPAHNFFPIVLFTTETMVNQESMQINAPVQKYTEEAYVKLMMAGGVWIKFLLNSAALISAFLVILVYVVIVFFRGIFSTK